MRIAIFGSRGFIGKTLVLNAPAKYEFFLFNRPEADVNKPETFLNKIKNIHPDVVVNLVALKGTILSSPVSVREMFETNTMGSLNLAYASRDAGAKSYIYISSAVVHGENKIGKHHGRFSVFAPKHPYGASKAAAEHALQQFAKQETNMPVVTLRPPQVIGKDTEIHIPPIEFVRDVLSGKEIRLFGNGIHEREYVSVTDVATGIWKAIEWSVSAERGCHPFFLTGNRTSMLHLAQKVVKKFGGKIVYVPKTVQTFSLTTDASESKRLLDWEPFDNLDSILDDVARHVELSRRLV